MRTKIIALALATMLTVGIGGVAAAGASSGNTAVEQMPDNYTVDVTDPFDELSSDEVDEAIDTASSSEQVQSSLNIGDDVHFNVVAVGEKVQVGIAPNPDAENQLITKVGPDGTVTDVFEPSLTADQSTHVDYNDITLAEDGESVSFEEADNVEHVDSNNITLVEDGESVSFEEAVNVEHLDTDKITLVEDGESISFDGDDE
jgi:hypothetical protein